MTNGDERCSDPVSFHIIFHVGAVIPQRIRRNQFVQGRVLLRLGRIFFPGENQGVVRADGHRLCPGIKLGLTDNRKDAGDGEIVRTLRGRIRRIALKFLQRIARRVRIGFECDQGLRRLQFLGAIDSLGDRLIRPGRRLESGGSPFLNNRDLRRATA